MENFRILKVTIDHFRGYRKNISFDLTGGLDLTILEGPNGYGKTSFFDAVEWAFTGKLFRYEGPDEDKRNCNIINFLPFEEIAVVTVEFGNGERKYTLCRKTKNNYADYGPDRTVVTVLGDDIKTLKDSQVDRFLNDILINDEYKKEINFKEVFSRYHMLTQDKMKNFIQGMKGPERYSEIISLIGNEKYLNYQEIFNKWVSQIKGDIDRHSSEKNKMKTEFDLLKAQVKSAPAINMGKFEDIDRYVNDIIKQYNILCSNSSLVRFNTPEECFESNRQVKAFSEHVLEQKGVLSGHISDISKREEEIRTLALNKNDYKANCNEIIRLEALKRYSEAYKDIDYCRKNVDAWNKHENNRKKTENRLKELTEKNKAASEMLIQLKQVVSSIRQTLLSELLNTDFEVFETEHKVEELVSWCKSDICQLLWDNIHIEVCPQPEQVLKIGGYTFKTYGPIEKHILLSDDFRNAVSLLREKATSLSEKLKGITEWYMNTQSRRKEIEADIDRLGKLDKSLKQILKDSLDYLEKHDGIDSSKQLCPVCKTTFAKGILVIKIKDQLSEQSEIIKEKTALAAKLKDELDQSFLSVKGFKDSYENAVKEFVNTLMGIDNYVSFAIKNMKSEEDKSVLEIQKIRDNLEITVREHKKFEEFIKKYAINTEMNAIAQDIEKKFNIILEKIKQLGYPLEHVYIDDTDDRINRLKTFVLLYENKITKYEINKYKLDEDIERLLNSLTSGLTDLKQRESKLESIEKQVVDVQSYFDTNEKALKLQGLMGKMDKKQNQIIELSQVIEKLNSISEASKKSVELMAGELLNQYAENINKIYKRIYPHPRFREFGFELDRTRRDNSKLNLFCFDDEERGPENIDKINPAYIFSSAQVNTLALSIFLGMAFSQKCTLLNSIFMDDPIQNLDDFNVFAFIDILRSSVNEGISSKLKKQVVLSTHDEMVYRLMRKKFRFYNCESFVFEDYNENGPLVLNTHLKVENS